MINYTYHTSITSPLFQVHHWVLLSVGREPQPLQCVCLLCTYKESQLLSFNPPIHVVQLTGLC